MFTLNCNGTLLDLGTPRIMGILNVTPDSFYDGGRYMSEREVLQQTEKMLLEGADIIDVGAMSSRPGAVAIDEQAELARLIPAIRAIVRQFPDAIISADTYRTIVANAAIDAGARLINDISGGQFDAKLPIFLSKKNIPYIIMHTQGNSMSMQQNPMYDDVVSEVYDSLSQRAHQYRQMGIKDIVIDPGFGFGKTITHNYQLLKHLDQFKLANLPILVGLSRKSMIYKLLNTTPEQALNGTTVLHTFALLKGAHILRVHDVKAAKEVVQLMEMMKSL